MTFVTKTKKDQLFQSYLVRNLPRESFFSFPIKNIIFPGKTRLGKFIRDSSASGLIVRPIYIPDIINASVTMRQRSLDEGNSVLLQCAPG